VRKATRIWCTASGSSARTAGSSLSSLSTCAPTAASTASPAHERRLTWRTVGRTGTREPSARTSFDGLRDTVAPPASSSACTSSSRVGWPSTSSTSHSRHRVRTGVSPKASAVTVSSHTSASTLAWASSNRCTTRCVVMVATGTTGRSRTYTRTGASTADGTFRVARPSGRCSSLRSWTLTGSLTCQPSSSPPVLRRNVMRCPARSSAGVSKYVALSCRCTGGATADTPAIEVSTGNGVVASTA